MFEREGARVIEERPARRRPLAEPEVRALLAQVSEVVIARGRRAETRAARDVRPSDLLGPTGSFRAPMVRCDGTLLVGFHRESLARLLEADLHPGGADAAAGGPPRRSGLKGTGPAAPDA